MVSSWATTGYIAFTYHHVPNSDDPLALFDKIYDKPWTRLGPYLIGMCVGWLLFKTNCKIRMSKVRVISLYWSIQGDRLINKLELKYMHIIAKDFDFPCTHKIFISYLILVLCVFFSPHISPAGCCPAVVFCT